MADDRRWARGGGGRLAAEIDPNRPGPPEAAWLVALRRRRVRRWLPPPPGHLVVVAPHPKDETLGAGGVISLLHRRGWRVSVLALTDGEAGHGGEAGLGPRRHAEQVAALTHLAPPGPARHAAGPDSSGARPGRVGGGAGVALARLGLPDGRLAQVTDLAERIGAWLSPDALCLAPWLRDGHPDHDAAARAAGAATAATGAKLGFVPIWAWHWQAPHEADFLRLASLVPLDGLARRRKAGALAAYRSQTRPLGREPTLPGHVLARFARPFELLAWPAS